TRERADAGRAAVAGGDPSGRGGTRVLCGDIARCRRRVAAGAGDPDGRDRDRTSPRGDRDRPAGGGAVVRADGGTDSGTGRIALPGGAIPADRDRGVLAEPPGGRAVTGDARSGARFYYKVDDESPREAAHHLVPPDDCSST